MRKNTLFLLISASMAILFCGCGYSARGLLGPDLKTIYVDNFKNAIDVGREITEDKKYAIYRPGIENEITSFIIDRFAFDGNLKIALQNQADLILNGTLTEYRKEALRYDNADNVEEYRIRITVNMNLVRKSDGKVLWTEKGFAGESTYNTMGRCATSEDTARSEATNDLARRIVERTVEGW